MPNVNAYTPRQMSFMQQTPYNNYQAQAARALGAQPSAFANTPPPMTAPSLGPPAAHQPAAFGLFNNAIGAGAPHNPQQYIMHEESKIYALVIDLMDVNNREAALLELSKKREQYDDLALVLWHSFGKRI